MNRAPFDHVLIIGAGTSGLALAHALKKRDLSARIIEAADRPCPRWRTRHRGIKQKS